MESVLQQIRAQRLMRKVTLGQLSGLTGLPVSFLEQLEEYKVDPPLSSLVKITSALNVTVRIGDISI
jgi:transcriptional regulator with XRE-family HTH domain